ncbi:MAG TPA: tRNA (N6-isopentenyl adenosine(37)-C2)-methylthiotransferase MiaB [Planctomycetaceae bacterium]|nr:tRNA (N6-isopentenyl adenosine(37)-C2)-methylthiotransferase MiaB [Planctomycetaceae bacterium]HIQ22097.1 tRNA (N6-isopentenyl adenosine(37)-C2)-methylthiotransferase MiaB [Planctomycetota bacterium]
MNRKLYIETVGCQMNVLDSELVAGQLSAAGYQLVASPRQADTILFNTCSVRQHAEDKIYSALGRLKHIKRTHPGKIIGVLGCMAQKDREEIFRRAPHVDLVVGPGQLGRLPELLERVASGMGPQLEVSLGRRDGRRSEVQGSFRRYDPVRKPGVRARPHQAMVRIMFGCDKFCSFCIVPSVRGPEQSRPPEEIEAEVRQLADQGCLEVTLLGQTVNHYGATSGGRTVRLADLLYRIHDTEGIRRIRFVTNFPSFMTDELLQAVRDLPKVTPYLHVPAQSGSNRILRRMQRGYTVEAYREMLARVRQTVPEAAVTSDFIVGFPGETEEDFRETVRLVEESRFKNSFIFKYSPRTGTKAAERYADDVPDEVKRRRNNELLAVQNAISEQENLAFRGRTVEVLVEGPSKTGRKQDGPVVQLTGRTVCDRIVVFDSPRGLAGSIVPVRIYDTTAVTLFGRVVSVVGVEC